MEAFPDLIVCEFATVGIDVEVWAQIVPNLFDVKSSKVY